MHKADYVMSVCFVLFFSLAQKEKSIKNNKNKIVKRRPKTSVSHSAPLCCKHSQIFYFILLFFFAAAASPPGETDVDFLIEVKPQSRKLSMRS